MCLNFYVAKEPNEQPCYKNIIKYMRYIHDIVVVLEEIKFNCKNRKWK